MTKATDEEINKEIKAVRKNRRKGNSSPILSSCENKQSYDLKFSKISTGMTKETVRRIVGKPEYIDMAKNGIDIVEVWHYRGFIGGSLKGSYAAWAVSQVFGPTSVKK